MAAIEIYYSIQILLNEIQEESLLTVNGADQSMNKYAVASDNINLVKRKLEDVANTLFMVVHKVGAETSYEYDIERDGEDGKYIVYTIYFPDTFNSKLMQPLDRLMRKYLVFNTLQEFFETKSIPNKLILQKAEKYSNEVTNLINYRKKGTIVRQYRR